jgi:L-histidine Nalpha-methyltransferase
VNTATTSTIECQTIRPTRMVSTLPEDVLNGLFGEPRTLPPKYFYDERGSGLFDQICDAPEYYPTRTESALLERIAGDVIESVRPECIVELGSGTSRKTRHLLNACDDQTCYPVYAPFDVCGEVLVTSGEALHTEYGWLDVQPMVGDYTAGLGNLPRWADRTLIAFLGGTIGNFTKAERLDFLADVRSVMDRSDMLLLGADRVKEPDVLHAAYNDDAGITAEFNLNLLRVMNRELGADFDLSGFEHYAYFNPLESRIEMHLISMRDQTVRFEDIEKRLEFDEGDHILTEISTKFTRAELEAVLTETGFEIVNHYESNDTKFSLLLAQPSP